MDDDKAKPPAGKSFQKINWLRAGILSADKVLTVSPNYAREISANPQTGVELDDVIRCAPGTHAMQMQVSMYLCMRRATGGYADAYGFMQGSGSAGEMAASTCRRICKWDVEAWQSSPEQSAPPMAQRH